MANENSFFGRWSRRDMLKGLGGIPLLGAVWYAGAKQAVGAKREKQFL